MRQVSFRRAAAAVAPWPKVFLLARSRLPRYQLPVLAPRFQGDQSPVRLVFPPLAALAAWSLLPVRSISLSPSPQRGAAARPPRAPLPLMQLTPAEQQSMLMNAAAAAWLSG